MPDTDTAVATPPLIYPGVNSLKAGLRGRCPRCGKGALFDGFLNLRRECPACGLSYAFADPADGPAFIVICFGCVPAVSLALGLQIAFSPPFWVHLLISLPFAVITSIAPLRPLKGWFIASQYFNKAREGRLVGTWHPYGPDQPGVSQPAHPW
ncbi:DUF983 domain-containing protein [Sphingomonas ginsenosidivorax]|uniref:DUF983 domain-containing protein n=1 Tax=Sphingomonas ginsenosidivorax TaxID=862135 RepID=A0A5C6UD11_9SPHN|nr:DUF983 domain-containing protein [Sphingomonas ginsenosidivorax]TXC70544.1 DUF983 domain-containing protein [Sphingomonas ginsenosidivorax]